MAMVLALDQGTTSSRAIVFDASARIIGMAQRDFPQHYPRPGWVEHDPMDLWRTQLQSAQAVLHETGVRAKDIAAIGITNQRETTLLWDRATGQPLGPAIVWQDRRTTDACRALREQGLTTMIRQRTGLLPDPYFSASKIQWMLDHIPDARDRALRGELALGTVDTWLLWQLTGGRVHATDPTNASRTMLFNLHERQWDPALLEMMNIPAALLATIVPSSAICGECDSEHFGATIPIAGLAGDQQAALLGQCGLQAGMSKNTYGTGCFLLMHTGAQPRHCEQDLLTTVAASIDGQPAYALEGSVFIGGAVVQWLRDGLGLIRSAGEIEALAASVPDTGDVYLVPAFAGLGAPHWDPNARGTITGLTRGTTAGHLARAALESIAFQVADVLDAMRQEADMTLPDLRVDGGAAINDLLLQFQADILQIPVVRPQITETTALGTAFLAGLATGFWKDASILSDLWQAQRTFEPAMSRDQAARRRGRWCEALERSRAWDQGPASPDTSP